MPGPKKNTAYSFTVALFDNINPGQLRVNPTLAAGDFQISQNHGALTALASVPTVSPAGSVVVLVSLTAAEMNCDDIDIVAHDVAGGEWTDLHVSFKTETATLTDIYAVIDTEVAAIKAKTDQLTFTAANKVDATLQAAADLASAVGQKIADMVLRRVAANIEASANGDTPGTGSLYGLIQRAEKSTTTAVAGKHRIYKSDGVTVLGDISVTVDPSAQDITAFS